MLSSAGSSFASPTSGGSRSSVPIRKSRLRRPPKKPVPTHVLLPTQSKNAAAVWFMIVCCLLTMTVLPIYILESIQDPEHHPRAVHGVHQLLDRIQSMKTAAAALKLQQLQKQQQQQPQPQPVITGIQQQPPPQPIKKESPVEKKPASSDQKKKKKNNAPPSSITAQQAKPKYTLQDLQSSVSDEDKVDHSQLSRGLSGRGLTPALQGAQRAHIECELNVDSVAYWNDPTGTRDLELGAPFATPNQKEPQYFTFSPDSGGWNNVRMSMEVLFVLAAVTGRILVLPPKAPLYLLNKDKGAKHRGFADFFPLNHPNFPVKTITMQEFLELPAQQALLQNEPNRTKIISAADFCDHRKISESFCGPLFDYLGRVGHNPEFSADRTCLIFDEQSHKGKGPSQDAVQTADTYCGHREKVYWNPTDHGQQSHMHFQAQDKHYRLLNHFYNMIYFSDPAMSHYSKRFVRDYLHYNDVIYCAAGKIVKAVQKEGMERGFALDAEGGGGFSAMHVRRGDLQYKKVKIPAQEWYDNTKEVWLDKEILYIATDERNKTFFDDLAAHYDLRFLDDYWDLAGLSDLDPNYMGMIDTIVASRGRAFAGTWFSTFTGYINRLRGYHGMSMKDSWYSYLPKKTAVHQWDIITSYAYAFEWPDGWVGIDADTWPERDKF